MTKLEKLKKALDVAIGNVEDADDYYWDCREAYIQELNKTKETTNE
jgi:7-cyano-7-deazaguanine synthase in queuosine biosynthesis